MSPIQPSLRTWFIRQIKFAIRNEWLECQLGFGVFITRNVLEIFQGEATCWPGRSCSLSHVTTAVWLKKDLFQPAALTLTRSAWQRGTLPSRGMSKLVVPLGERETALSDVTKGIEDPADSFPGATAGAAPSSRHSISLPLFWLKGCQIVS